MKLIAPWQEVRVINPSLQAIISQLRNWPDAKTIYRSWQTYFSVLLRIIQASCLMDRLVRGLAYVIH